MERMQLPVVEKKRPPPDPLVAEHDENVVSSMRSYVELETRMPPPFADEHPLKKQFETC